MFFLLLKTTGSFHSLKPDRGRAPWACHIYYKPIVISHFSTIYLHNFFPEPHIDSDLYYDYFFISTPRIIISTQLSFWTAHNRHSPSGIMKNPIFKKNVQYQSFNSKGTTHTDIPNRSKLTFRSQPWIIYESSISD